MKTTLLMFFLAATLAGARASEDEGLFVVAPGTEPRQEIKDGEIVLRWKAERLRLTQAVFRHDTEDRKQYWLELDFTKWTDPGDFYLFTVGGNDYTGFTVRGNGTNEGGGRWALGITDADLGRELLTKISRIYHLSEAHVLDQTQGEQGGADQPATAPESMSEGNKKPKPESEGRSQ